MAYQHLPPVSYNVLNQTKIFSAACFCYFLLGKRIPVRRLMAQLEQPTIGPLESRVQETEFSIGVVPILLASMISGLAGALCQKPLQEFGRDPYLFSMEISVCSSFVLVLSLLLGSPDTKKIGDVGLTHGWTRKTWLPLLSSKIILFTICCRYI